MSITIDFILLFILVIIPGLLFKRFYFFGEFSKQFSTKETVYKSIFYSIIPGSVIQIFAFWIYITARNPGFNIEDTILIFKEVFSNKSEYSEATSNFLANGFNTFLIHELNVFLLAIILGFVFSRAVRIFKLDINYKVFRFKNQWYYVFSGEIRSFKKFKINARIINLSIDVEENHYKYYPPYADILVEGGAEGASLYTGFVIDYDLNYENINDLDKIYLLGACRYKSENGGEGFSGSEVSASRVKVPIKGDVFILPADRIVNMNLTFIPSPEKIKQQKTSKNNRLRWVFRIGSGINTLIFLFLLFINTPLLKGVLPKVTEYLSSYNFLERILLSTIINLIIVLMMPSELVKQKKAEQDKKYGYSWQDWFIKIGVLAICLGLYYFFVT